MSAGIPTPPSIFCPRCGASMRMERITDAQNQAKLEEAGYVAGARGMCPCGVTAVLAIKRMPENPTFTLMFNIYKLDVKREGK
jgi:hypothetical protein